MKKIIKILSILFLLGSLSNLVSSQNIRTFAKINNKIDQKIKNKQALERLTDYNKELEFMVKNNVPLYPISFPRDKNNMNDENLLMNLYIAYSSEDIFNNDGSINEDICLNFDLDLFAGASPDEFITNSDKIFLKFYDDKKNLVQEIELNDVSTKKDPEKTKIFPAHVSYKNKIKLKDFNLDVKTIYNLEILDSEGKLLGTSKFKSKSRFLECVNSNLNPLGVYIWLECLPSNDGDSRGVVHISATPQKKDSFLNENMVDKKICLNFYNIKGECIATRNTKVKRISYNDGSADVFSIDIYSNKNELQSIYKDESFIVELLDENKNYLGSYLVPKDFVSKPTDVNEEKPQPVFSIDKQKLISDYVHFLSNDIEKESIISRLFEEGTIYESIDQFEYSQSNLKDKSKTKPDLYIISKLNDPDSLFANYSGSSIYFTISNKNDDENNKNNVKHPNKNTNEKDAEKNKPLVVFKSEVGQTFEEIGSVIFKFKISDNNELMKTIRSVGWGRNENCRLIFYSDEALNNKIGEIYFNIPKI